MNNLRLYHNLLSFTMEYAHNKEKNVSNTFRATVIVLLLTGLLLGCQQTSVEVTPEESKSEEPTSEEPKSEEPKPEEPKSETWMRIFGGGQPDVVRDALLAEDGGVYLLGATNISWEPKEMADIYLIRTDKYGELLWDKKIKNSSFSLGESLIFTENDSILIAGVTRIDPTRGADILLSEVDLDGNLLQIKALGGEMDEWVQTIHPTRDGGFILFGSIVDPDDFVANPGAAGYGGFENRSSIFVIRFDRNGEEVWNRSLDNGENVITMGAALAPDGGSYIIASILNYPDMDNDMLLVKIDGDGNEVWSRTWEDDKISPRSFSVTPEGNLLIGALFSISGDLGFGDADYLIMEVDELGEEIWKTTFDTPDEDSISGLIKTEDNGYLLVGERSLNLFEGESNLVLIKLDDQREVVWEKAIDHKQNYMICDLIPTDGGYIIATTFYYSTRSTGDILLIKTDLNGDFAD